MSKFSINELPREDLSALGLFKHDQLTLDPSIKSALLNGRVTTLLHLKDIRVDGLEIKNLDAKLSLARKDNGEVGLYVHPILKNRSTHPDLSPEENQAFSQNGTHAKHHAANGKITNFGEANYQFDEKNKRSFFIELEKPDGDRIQIWGVDLERALKDSKKNIGDDVQLEFKGKQPVEVEIDGKWETRERYTWDVSDLEPGNRKEETRIYEFDKETNSFISIDSENVLVPEEVNGMLLTEKQKKKLKSGQVVEMPDNTMIQASPSNAKNNFLNSNRRLLMASVLLDGGISFVLVKGAQLAIERLSRNKEQQHDQLYNKGYRDALAKVQADLERKSKEFPNNKEIIQDLNTVKAEYSRTATVNTYNDAEEKSINQTKGVVNDPELDDNAARQERGTEKVDKEFNRTSRDLEHDADIDQGVEREEKVGRGR